MLGKTNIHLTRSYSMKYNLPMITTVTKKNMITIPASIAREYGIKPGFRFEWQKIDGEDEILIRVIPSRAELARRLLGQGHQYAPERDAVQELIEARRAEEEE